MWFFDSPHVVFGEDALSYLEQLTGRLAFIVTDGNLARLGLLQVVQSHLEAAGIPARVIASAAGEPTVDQVTDALVSLPRRELDGVVLVAVGGGRPRRLDARAR